MSEQLLQILTQLKLDDPQVVQYVTEQHNNPEFGNIVFRSLQTALQIQDSQVDQKNLIVNLTSLLKSWARLNCLKMSFEQLAFYFNNLKTLILSVPFQYVNHFSAPFYDIAKSIREVGTIPITCYETNIPDFLTKLSDIQNCQISQIIAILEIIEFSVDAPSLKRNHSPEEISSFHQQVLQIIFPFFSNSALLNQEESPQVMKLILNVFKNIFFAEKNNSMDLAEIPIQFCNQIELLFISREMTNSKIVCSAIEFLTKFYSSKQYGKIFEANVNELLSKYFQILVLSLQGERDSYFISRILLAIEPFASHITAQKEIIDVLLESSCLLQNDIDNFMDNPSLFYYDVYSTDSYADKTAPRMARSLLWNVVSSSQDKLSTLLYLLTIQNEHNHPKENVIRCLSLCLSQIDEIPEPFFQYANQLIEFIKESNDPFLAASILYLLIELVDKSSTEQNSHVMENLPFFFNLHLKVCPVINLFAVQLIEKLIEAGIDPFDNACEAIIETLPNSFTGDPATCLKSLASTHPEVVLPHADIIIENIAMKLQQSFDEIQQCDDDTDSQLENIESHLVFASQLISSTGSFLVRPFMISTVQFIFENSLTDILDDDDSFLDFLKSIFRTDSEKIPELIQLIFKSFSDEIWIGFCGILMQPFIEMISSNLQVFLQLNMSPFLIENCIKLMASPEINRNPDNYFDVAALISFVVGADSLHCENAPVYLGGLVEWAKGLYQQEKPKLWLLSIYNEINVSLFVSFGVPLEGNIIHCIFEAVSQNVALRNYQKLLYALFFLNLSIKTNQLAEQAVPIAFELLLRLHSNANDEEEEMDESIIPELEYLTFPFNYQSPYEQFKLNESIAPALNLCTKETVEGIKQKYGGILQHYSTNPA